VNFHKFSADFKSLHPSLRLLVAIKRLSFAPIELIVAIILFLFILTKQEFWLFIYFLKYIIFQRLRVLFFLLVKAASLEFL
jgi:hypothetical protein